MTLNVEAYEYTPLAQHGVGLRLFVDEMIRPRRQIVSVSPNGVLLAPGTRAELTLQRRYVIDDVGNNADSIDSECAKNIRPHNVRCLSFLLSEIQKSKKICCILFRQQKKQRLNLAYYSCFIFKAGSRYALQTSALLCHVFCKTTTLSLTLLPTFRFSYIIFLSPLCRELQQRQYFLFRPL